MADTLIRSILVGPLYMKFFHREGLVRSIKENTGENGRKFLERNYPDIDKVIICFDSKLISLLNKMDELIKEEKELDRVTALLHEGSITAHDLAETITNLFCNAQELSTYQFIKSGFSEALLKYVLLIYIYIYN